MMVSCSRFLSDYSDYRDGLMDSAREAAYRAHLARCPSCARYDRVVGAGVCTLRSLPQIPPSADFLPRLQHRLYHLEDGLRAPARADSSATSLGFVLLLVLLIGAAAWLPLLRPEPPLMELPPVAAAAPVREEPVHALFRAGPLLTPPLSSPLANPPSLARLPDPPVTTLFFRYSPMGSYARYTNRSFSAR